MNNGAQKAARAFHVDPWRLRTARIDPADLAACESLFALSNGHIGLRGSLEEGEPRVVPGTYISGFFEERPLPHPEAGYGFPESGQTIVNVTDGKLIRLHVGDSPFDLRYGRVDFHERALDLRAGVLERRTDWTAPNGSAVRVTSRRLVSFTQRVLAAISYEVEPLDDGFYMALQSDLLANDEAVEASRDPRDPAPLTRPLRGELTDSDGHRAVLVHGTARSRLRVAAGMDHLLDLPTDAVTTMESEEDLARLTVTCQLLRGQRLRVVKLLAYGWSSRRSAAALRDQVDAALAVARLAGWDALAAQQREYLDRFWERGDVQIEGDPALQQAVRVSMFHVLQAGARTESQAIPAKGLTGPGYDGHAFWDTETFVLPMLTYTTPEAAKGALTWRHNTLPTAMARAAELGLGGAAFPWRTIHGEECSGYWPAGTAAFHVNADIADATARYIAATGDQEFAMTHGVELLVQTARLWASLGHFASEDCFRIDGVTGPDEYTAVVDDNVFTNLMAQRNLRAAAEACTRWPEVAARLEVSPHEMDRWQAAADVVRLPYDDKLGVHPQSEGFTDHGEWDFEATPPEDYPLLLHHPYFQLYRKQVVKQADLVLAMHLRGDAFTPQEKARNFAYYEARTVRDSSLSAAPQAIIAAEVGHLDLAYDYWTEAAFTDILNVHGNVDDGVHIAAAASTWAVAVAGFGGMRDHSGHITFAPRLPPKLSRLCFRMMFNRRTLIVDVHRDESDRAAAQAATYRLLAGDPVETSHHGTPVTLKVDDEVTLPVPPPPIVDPVTQPFGRTPQRRT
ncbi:family 65 glycosyl hydrolase [Nocardioides gansuensis]|uniref:Family 65 glycosyl hydrolase n=1 Tax=Nocardioides gansuensis TaxID=2138300 RepID=A0A2T8FGE7_9ACTN|nr:glycosyl hydrolase family 65 protein [Nocardioides gansuensis]PVG84798.1 family 65 glycosyl hydrolase [Nocardioides gansuensis]